MKLKESIKLFGIPNNSKSREAPQSTKILLVVLSIMIFMVFLPSTSAFKFDNVKDYDYEKREVTITNAFGLGEEIAKLKLVSEQTVYVMPGEDRRVAEIKFINFDSDYSNPLRMIEFYNNKDNTETLREYTYKKKVQVGTRDAPIWENDCNGTLKNGTKYCEGILVGTVEVPIYDWVEISSVKELSPGDTIGIYTDVKYDDDVEWIPTYFDERIDEWASWVSSLNTGIVSWWTMNDTAGNGVNQVKPGSGDITTNLASVTRGSLGIVNSSYYFPGANNDYVETSTGIANLEHLNMSNGTLSFWANFSTADNNRDNFLWGYWQFLNNDNHIRVDFYDVNAGNDNEIIIAAAYGAAASKWAYSTTNDKLEDVRHKWTHFVIVHNGVNTSMYINGVYNEDYTYTASIDKTIWFRNVTNNIGTNTKFSIGALREDSRTDLNWGGHVDEFGIWNRSLTETEILNLYNGGDGLTYQQGSSDPSLTVSITRPLDNSGFAQNVSIVFNATIEPSNTNITNTTLFVWNSSRDLVETSQKPVTGEVTNTTNFTISNLSSGIYDWNVWACTNTSNSTFICGFAPNNYSLNVYVSAVIGSFLNRVVYETAQETILQNITVGGGNTPSTANLIWDSTAYTGTITNIVDNNYTLSSTFNVPTGNGNKSWHWNVTYATGFTESLNVSGQRVDTLSFVFCNESVNHTFINMTYKNETVLQENVTASVSSSTWYYWLGTGTINKSLSFSDATEDASHGFCLYPFNKTLNTQVTYNYDNTESQQRVFFDDDLQLSNTTTNQTLWLLPTSDGIFVTFQIINVAEQPIEGAKITITRSGFGQISSDETGASGTATFFLNPNFVYTITVEKENYATYSATQAFTNTEYTIQLGGSNNAAAVDYTKGVRVTGLNPKIGEVLYNGTNYNFSLTLSSSYWELDQFGFYLSNGSDIFATTSKNSPGTISTIINTGQNTSIVMNYYWVINSTYLNSTYIWSVSSLETGSIYGFFTRLRIYATEDRIFGMTSFTLWLFTFLIIFLFVGVLSYKFGLVNPSTIAILIGIFILFLSTVGLIDSSLVTILAGLLVIGIIIWEVVK